LPSEGKGELFILWKCGNGLPPLTWEEGRERKREGSVGREQPWWEKKVKRARNALKKREDEAEVKSTKKWRSRIRSTDRKKGGKIAADARGWGGKRVEQFGKYQKSGRKKEL